MNVFDFIYISLFFLLWLAPIFDKIKSWIDNNAK